MGQYNKKCRHKWYTNERQMKHKDFIYVYGEDRRTKLTSCDRQHHGVPAE